MQKVIDQITDQLVGLVDKDRSSYTPQELLKAGIPNYIVERVRLLLEDKVLLDLQRPTSIWIDTEAELFEHAWKDFKTTAFSNSVIPQQKLHAIIHHTINDIISVFVEPRKYMAAYLFREDEQLSFDEISKRCSRLTIYKHFGAAIPLYMKKRGLEEISLDRCTKLIANLDARIVAGYTAEDWAQKLELLFTLFGGKLDSKLISLFFEDKGYREAANVFSSLDVPITQSTFIELLSSVPMTVTTDARETVPSKVQEKPDPLIAEEKEDVIEDSQEDNLASAFQSQQADTEMNEILGDITHEGLVEEDNLEEAKSLNAIFESEEDEELSDSEPSIPKEEEQEELRSNLSSILGQAKDSYEGVVNEVNSEVEDEIIDEEDLFEEPVNEKFIRPITTLSDELVEEDELIEDSPEEIVKESEETHSEEEDGEEKPMWAQFLSADQMEVMMATRDSDEEAEREVTSENMNSALYVEDDDDDIIVEEPFEIDTVRKDLSEYLYPNEDRWIKKVFSGKEKAYTNATVYIGGLSSWKEASEFVENEIFSKHKVDMFSEEAIEFIDVLQAYFKEYKS